MKVKDLISTNEMFLLNLLFDQETQQRFIKLIYKYVGINKDKCPSFRQILRVSLNQMFLISFKLSF